MPGDDEGVEVQWRVTWFPPGKDQVARGTEAKVRRIAQQQAEWNPIIEWREVTIGPWQMEGRD